MVREYYNVGGTWIFQYDVEMKVPLSRQWKKKEGTNGK
jgi:hypothetical protein